VHALLLAGGSLSHGDQLDQEAKNDARVDGDLTTGQVGGQELRPRLASGSDAGNESYDAMVRLVRKKDGEGDPQSARPRDGAESVRQRLLDLTRKPDPPDQKALPMEEGLAVSALELTLELFWRGIHLEVVGAKIRYVAPPGALDRELREVGRRHMDEMVDVSGGLTGES